jgi:hypothetical protein
MKNLNLTGGLVFSQRVLLELPKAGVSREDAYRIVQRNAMRVWEEIQQGKPTTNEKGESLYLQYLLEDEELREKLSETQIRECFNFDYYTKNVDKIFARVFGEKYSVLSGDDTQCNPNRISRRVLCPHGTIQPIQFTILRALNSIPIHKYHGKFLGHTCPSSRRYSRR